jgi:CubicO group peptidase (beta-lactamase class C family)
VTLANWRAAPFNRWAFQHVREIVPPADIPHDPSKALSLPTATINVDHLCIPDAQGTAITLDEFLQRASTDALVVLHEGRIVIERYANAMGPRTPHILMSVSKSLLGLLTGILVAQDKVDPDELVTDVVPEVVGTAYEGAKVRHLLDMRTGVAFDEDYAATSGPIASNTENRQTGTRSVLKRSPRTCAPFTNRSALRMVITVGAFITSRPTPTCWDGWSSGRWANGLPT